MQRSSQGLQGQCPLCRSNVNGNDVEMVEVIVRPVPSTIEREVEVIDLVNDGNETIGERTNEAG